MARKQVGPLDGLNENDIWFLQYVAEYNDEEVKAALGQAIAVAMEKVGLAAEGDVKRYMTDKGIVDTGRLRNSITHQVTLDGGDTSVMVGTNVEYGPYVELGIHGKDGRHFLRDSIQSRLATYRGIIEGELQG